ncbi:MAG: hypothetical protein KC476_04775 [Cyanobacteria bacterium HKST-UBA06]|nr:hypothetical protein [Cyanobacteria bacterium HKST-UBA06]
MMSPLSTRLPIAPYVSGRPALRSPVTARGHMQASTQTKFRGLGSVIMKPVAWLMPLIEGNENTKLAVTDLGAMVIPRTSAELVHRGPEMGFETIFREINTTLNIYMIGWLGALSMAVLSLPRINPKAMSLKGWINANTLKAFGDLAHETLVEARQTPMSADEIQRSFLSKALNRIESTDQIAKMPFFKKYFPHQGKLDPAVRDELINRYQGGPPANNAIERLQNQHRAYNIEAEVSKLLRNEQGGEPLLAQMIAEQKEKMGLSAKDKLPEKTMVAMRNRFRQQLADTRLEMRQMVTRKLRREEKPFLDALHKLVIEKGGLSSELFMLNDHGVPIIKTGGIPTRRYLAEVKYFMEEFLNRALANPSTGRISRNKLGPRSLRLVTKRLGLNEASSWAMGLIPRPTDSLINYAFKTHRLMTLGAVGLVTGLAVSVVYINNAMTRKRHGGVRYFPGEGEPDPAEQSTPDFDGRSRRRATLQRQEST